MRTPKADTESRHRKPTPKADTEGRHRKPTPKAAVLVGLLFAPAGCALPEPDFHRSALIEEAEVEESEASLEEVPPDLEMLRAAGLEGTLSEGTPPPPFYPDEAHYPPVPPEGNLQLALRGGRPYLLDALRVENAEGDTLVTAVEVGGDGSRMLFLLPADYGCTAPGTLVAGQRYVLITTGPDERGRHRLYLGVGAQYSIMPVDERGAVQTPLGSRDAMDLVAEARRSV